MKILITALFIVLAANTGFSTVEEVYQHKLFKELHSYVVEDSPYIGIGWTPIGAEEDNLNEAIEDLMSQGYRWSKFPYKLELILFIAFVILSGLSGSRYSRMQQYRRQHEEK